MKNSKNTVYTLRIVVGFYLLYLDYSILSDWQNVKKSNIPYMIFFISIFAAFALVLIAFSVKGLIKNKKNQSIDKVEEDIIDKAKDKEDEKEEETEEEENTIEKAKEDRIDQPEENINNK